MKTIEKTLLKKISRIKREAKYKYSQHFLIMLAPTTNKKLIMCVLNPTIPMEIIDETLLLELFEQYGIVKNIVIFEKDTIVKAFIEMGSL